jgi:hypothetical protein
MADATNTNESLESDIAGLLGDLSAVQRDLLDVLTRKRTMLAAGDGASLSAMAAGEEQLMTRLQACQERRQRLLEQAAAEGRPADSIRALAGSLKSTSRDRLKSEVEEAQHRSRLLQHEALTNWVLVQRSLLHLSQLVEIIATGGRMQPTYGNGSDRLGRRNDVGVGGALVDRAV